MTSLSPFHNISGLSLNFHLPIILGSCPVSSTPLPYFHPYCNDSIPAPSFSFISPNFLPILPDLFNIPYNCLTLRPYPPNLESDGPPLLSTQIKLPTRPNPGAGGFCHFILLMPGQERVLHRVAIKCEKDRQAFRRRQEKAIEGSPRVWVGAGEAGWQQVWTEELRGESIGRLKELNSSEKAVEYARTIMGACVELAPVYGYFIINENMIFFNSSREIFAWINPDILENHVKIYLPLTHDGEMAMLRSILTYLKLWLKCDYQLLAEAKHLNELPARFDALRSRNPEQFRAKSPDRDFLANRRNSVNLEGQHHFRYPEEGVRIPAHQLLHDSKSTREMKGCSPGREDPSFLSTSMSNKMGGGIRFNYVSPQDPQRDEFEHRTFTNLNGTSINKSVGPKAGSYFPNKTTSNKNHIVSMINKLDDNPNGYAQNKILLEDEKHDRERKKMKESLDGIGEELDGLFLSNIENEEQTEHQIKQMEAEFQNLLD